MTEINDVSFTKKDFPHDLRAGNLFSIYNSVLFYRLKFKFFFDIGDRFVYRYADLFHRVAVAYGYGTVLCRLEIYGYAVRRADFVLTAVTVRSYVAENFLRIFA